jgi:MYXO-CTERM domain-containing protein
MKRVLPLLLAMIGLLLCAPLAQGQLRQGGYDEATRQLEEGFKIVSTTRVFADDECYPSPEEVAAELRKGMGIEVVVAPSLDSVQGFDLVNVVSGETECNRLVLAIRAGAKGRVFVLDSDYGPVYVQGGQGLSEASLASGAGPLRDLGAGVTTVSMHRADEKSRFETHCPDATSPLGGGWVNATPIGNDGDGLYPHSYERLGVQGGFHVTATYIDRSNRAQSPQRRAEIQVVCGHGLVPTAAPHETTFITREGTGTVTARCPEGTELFSGGFQRTNFLTPGVETNGIRYGGDYVTESRADGNGWRVSGAAADRYGGELTAIAYCAEDPSLPVTEVSSSVQVGRGRSASATTPSCPDGHALIAGGFSFGDSHDGLVANGYFTRAGTWSATGYGWFGSADLTAYGYCAEVRDRVDRSAFPKEPPPGPEPDEGSRTLLYVGLGLAALAILAFLRRRQVVRRRRRRWLKRRVARPR